MSAPLAIQRHQRPFRLGRVLLPLLLSLSSSALAEDGTEEAEAETSDEAPQEVVITEKARSHFRAGVNLLQDPDGARYEEAYAQFKAAYAESPSWKILNNFGITAMKLERDGEAIDAFQGYLDGGGDELSEEERAQTQRDLETLQASVVTLTIKGTPEGIKLNDQRVTNRGGNVVNQYTLADGEVTLRVRPGQHKITARLPGYEEAVWEVSASAASNHEHVFELQKPKPGGAGGGTTPADGGAQTHRPVPTSVWIGAGVSGALLAGAVGTGIVALGKNTEFDDANREGDSDADDLRNDVKTFNLVTDILIGGAVAGGVVTTILYLTRPEVPMESAFVVEPVVGPQGAALSVRGEF